MSADSVFIGSSVDREQSNTSRRKFEAPEGDHCTLLNVYRGYRLARKEGKLKVFFSFLLLSLNQYMSLELNFYVIYMFSNASAEKIRRVSKFFAGGAVTATFDKLFL